MKASAWSIRSRVMTSIAVTHLTWKRYLEATLLKYGVNIKQATLLALLRERGHVHPAEIAEAFFCDRPTATSLIDTLARHGWVEREPDPVDGRNVRILLTAAGRAKLASLPEDASRNHPQPIDPLACLSDPEREQLDRLLARVAEHAQKSTCDFLGL